jgi:hypothetical protein
MDFKKFIADGSGSGTWSLTSQRWFSGIGHPVRARRSPPRFVTISITYGRVPAVTQPLLCLI